VRLSPSANQTPSPHDARIRASLELGQRLTISEIRSDPVRDPAMLARSLVARYGHHVQERLGAVYLDAKSRVIREHEIYVRTLNSTTVSTRYILRLALAEHAAGIIGFHNHPSGVMPRSGLCGSRISRGTTSRTHMS
jgi:DNA repair protein RadC